MATQMLIATRARLTLDEYEAAKVAAIRANQSLADWLGSVVRAALTPTDGGKTK